MKARRGKSDLRKPTRQESSKRSDTHSNTTVQTTADSAPADYSSPIYRPGALSNNVSRTLQKRSMSSINGGKTSIYPKMTVNAPNDRYEREADHMAQEVVQRIQRTPQSTAASTQSNSEHKPEKRPKTIQRQPEAERQRLEERLGQDFGNVRIHTDSNAQNVSNALNARAFTLGKDIFFGSGEYNPGTDAGKHLLGHELAHVVQQTQGHVVQQKQGGVQRKSAIQREFADGGMEASPEVETAINQESGKGQSLPEALQGKMEDAFGEDFSNVRIHTGSKSAQLNRAIQAEAFTQGSDIFFNQGAYNPNSRSGQELLAHELSHVVQQGG